MKHIVIGNGAIGRERIKALTFLDETIIAVIDVDGMITGDLIREADWVFICTPNDIAESYVEQIDGRCRVMVEKPYIGDTPVDNVGLNYRFYKGVSQLLKDVLNMHFGRLVSVNMTLALGGSPGDDNTWRRNVSRMGRGSILDLGIHLIDLAMIISNNTLKPVWYEKVLSDDSELEQEGYLLAKDCRGVIYNIQTSFMRWRSTFRIEVNGEEGYGIVEGRNRHYGDQTYIRGKRWGWLSGKAQRDTEELVVDYDGEDSFIEETKAVLYGTNSRFIPATFDDNKICVKLINEL
jgi:predicted dehydrogenase